MSEETIALDGHCVRLYIEGVLCACSTVDITYSISGPPSLTATMPATSEIVSAVRPRLKVHCVFMDFTYALPIPTLFFEGEIVDHGFSMTPQSRQFSITAVHITFPWQSVPINILKPEDTFSSQLRGTSTFQTLVPDVEGSIFSIFSPQTVKGNLEKIKKEPIEDREPLVLEEINIVSSEIQESVSQDIQANKIKAHKEDLYNYITYVAKFYDSLADVSPIRDGYDFKALKQYELYDRIFFPSLGSMVDWEGFFSRLLNLYYMDILSTEGGSLSLLEVIKSISSIILQELVILPNPSSYSKTCILKPYLHFSPIPRCNYINPNFVNTVAWNETHTSKPTRLIQYAPPGITQVDPDLAYQFKDIAPPELAAKFDAYNEKRFAISKQSKEEQEAKTEKDTESKLVYDIHNKVIEELKNDDPNFSLVTEEEKRRGIVESSNNIPRHIMSAIELIYKKDVIPPSGGGSSTAPSVQNSIAVDKITKQLSKSPVTQLQQYLTVAYRVKYFDSYLSNLATKKSVTPDLTTAWNSNNYFILDSEKISINVVWATNERINTAKNNKSLPHYYITKENGNLVALELLPRLNNLFQHSFYMPKVLPIKNKVVSTGGKTKDTDEGIVGSGGLIFVTDSENDKALSPTANIDIDKSVEAMKGSSFSNITICINPSVWRDSIPKIRTLIVDMIIGLYGLSEPGVTSIKEPNIFSYDSLGWSDTIKSAMGYDDSEKKQAMGSFLKTVRDEVVGSYDKEYKTFDKELSKNLTTQGYEKGLNQLNKLFSAGVSEQEIATALDNIVDRMKFNFSEQGATSEISATTVVTSETASAVKQNYTQPLCNFYFYYNRYASFTRSLYLVFNPYIVPGFPAFIQDRIEADYYPLHLLGYVQQVSHSFSPNSISTNITMSNMRRIDDFSDGVLMRSETLNTLVGVDLSDIKIEEKDTEVKTIYQQLKVDFPFFGGEWGKYYNYTTKEALGIESDTLSDVTLKFDEIIQGPTKQFNFLDSLRDIRRKIQRVKIQGVLYKEDKAIQLTSTEIQSNIQAYLSKNQVSDKLKRELEQTIQYITLLESEYISAPSKATMVYNLNENGFFVVDITKFGEDLLVDGLSYDPVVQEKITAHTSRCRNSNAQAFLT